MDPTALPAVLLMGPTASGKSGLALRLAQHFPIEIISVDSAQVYRGMDIGTAKPDAAEQAAVPHHLIDILDPLEAYSAARFVGDAVRLVDEIRGRGRLPLLVGGTMLYFRALRFGLSDLPSADPAVRARIEAEARRDGWPALHRRLQRLDPLTAQRLHPNDQQRIQRALEIIELSGVSASAAFAQPISGAGSLKLLPLALSPPLRSVLHARIERRFETMMRQGFLDEVRALYRRGDLGPELPSIRSVGYRQLWAHLAGECTLDEAVARAVAATRQFAKRQLTWLRSDPDAEVFDPEAPDLLSSVVARIVRAERQA
ncbi:tRNA (adenosine(37)-N6)-dimethylallyltransferase MiaA [Sinimarinibacterium sp. CAU 1509]|uniref:tRNA (adenosine(37)-N6)-dimethylallyltransferase MiaA n=1 Tax=Sinimarinibacterium sp. CAU 1509 TaxID=2562283 RepID=UPI0010ACA2C1|nr:tRNA (adenosine(37)-N6)-dimethylallyltransferase MiaA [Sinimarinibacterium sp. CAU 1509]TJY60927.1 tRNA (adenosine(37)-N6)-dimethylallyltransferase MiaA [Sinimarinibacterium sp. CAU 1509]